MKIRRKVQVWPVAAEGGALRILLFRTHPMRGAFWQPVTGHVEGTETLEEAAQREFWEESGIEAPHLESLDHTHRFKHRYSDEITECEEFCYAVFLPACVPPRIDPHEHDRAEWVRVSEAMGRVGFDVYKEMLKKIMERYGE